MSGIHVGPNRRKRLLYLTEFSDRDIIILDPLIIIGRIELRKKKLLTGKGEQKRLAIKPLLFIAPDGAGCEGRLSVSCLCY